MLLLAVLEKRGGLAVSGCDVYVNVVGGLQLDEPRADLATLLAVASSYRDVPIGSDLAAIGEVGLSGEVRSVTQLDHRLSETARLGFRSLHHPGARAGGRPGSSGAEADKRAQCARGHKRGIEMSVKYIKTPHLPERKVGLLALGERYRQALEAALLARGVEPLWLPDTPGVDTRLAGHADLALFHAGGATVVSAGTPDADDDLARRGFTVLLRGLPARENVPARRAALRLPGGCRVPAQ